MTALTFGSENDQPNPQCVRVYVEDRGPTNSAGSGTYITPLLIATCNHVVSDRKEDRCEVVFPNQERIQASVIKTSKSPDVAILKLDRAPKGVKPIASASLVEGQALEIQGYGKGDWKSQSGTLSDTKYGDGVREVSGARARSGDSGGPVLDKQGSYIGTLWGSNKAGTYFTPAKLVFKIAEIEADKPHYPQPILY